MSDSLAGRVERLERANRRLSLALGISLPLAMAPWLVAAVPEAPATTIAIRELVLRDASGERRGGFRVERDGTAALVLADGRGAERVSLSTGADGRSTLAFTDAAGHPRAVFRTVEDSSLNFYDRKGKLRAALGVTEYGPRWVSEAVDRAVRQATASGTPFAIGGELTALGPEAFESQDGPVLRFFDPRGRPRLEARVDMDRPVIFLHTEQGTLQVVRPADASGTQDGRVR